MVKLKNLTLATGQIIKFNVPQKLKRGREHIVEVEVQANGKYLFLTLLLENPDKEQQWWADNDSIDLVRNGGKLNLKNENYKNSWGFPIFSDAKLGEYTAFIGMYQDTYGLPTLNRRLIAYKQKRVKVV
jgi:hypothetical protein